VYQSTTFVLPSEPRRGFILVNAMLARNCDVELDSLDWSGLEGGRWRPRWSIGLSLEHHLATHTLAEDPECSFIGPGQYSWLLMDCSGVHCTAPRFPNCWHQARYGAQRISPLSIRSSRALSHDRDRYDAVMRASLIRGQR